MKSRGLFVGIDDFASQGNVFLLSNLAASLEFV